MLRPFLAALRRRPPGVSGKSRRIRRLTCEPLEARRLLATLSCGAEAEDDPELCLDRRAALVEELDGEKGGEGESNSGGLGSGGSGGEGEGLPPADPPGGEGEGTAGHTPPANHSPTTGTPPSPVDSAGGDLNTDPVPPSPSAPGSFTPLPSGGSVPLQLTSGPSDRLLSATLSDIVMLTGLDESRRDQVRPRHPFLGSLTSGVNGRTGRVDAFFQHFSPGGSNFMEVVTARMKTGGEGLGRLNRPSDAAVDPLPEGFSLPSDATGRDSSWWDDVVGSEQRAVQRQSVDEVVQTAAGDGLLELRLWHELMGHAEQGADDELVVRPTILAQLIELSPGSMDAGGVERKDADRVHGGIAGRSSAPKASASATAVRDAAADRRSTPDVTARGSIELAQRRGAPGGN